MIQIDKTINWLISSKFTDPAGLDEALIAPESFCLPVGQDNRDCIIRYYPNGEHNSDPLGTVRFDSQDDDLSVVFTGQEFLAVFSWLWRHGLEEAIEKELKANG